MTHLAAVVLRCRWTNPNNKIGRNRRNVKAAIAHMITDTNIPFRINCEWWPTVEDWMSETTGPRISQNNAAISYIARNAIV